MSRFGTETQIREAIRNQEVPTEFTPVDGETYPVGFARIENPKTGEKRLLKKDHKERVKIWHIETGAWILRRPVDAWELLGLGQASFDEVEKPEPNVEAPAKSKAKQAAKSGGETETK